MLFGEDMAAFFRSGISVTVVSRNALLTPSIARAKGCRLIQGTPARIRVFISVAHAGDCLDDIRASGMVSAALSRPNTHRSVQFKGSDARIVELTSEDRAALVAAEAAFIAVIDPLGFAPSFTHAFLESPDDEVAIEFTPTDAFQQTPGPGAGARIS
jgi:hypothetical protein